MILGGGPPLRDLGIGDAADVYWALLYDRTGVFEQQTIDMRAKLESEIAGSQLAAIDELMEMRTAMGLDAAPTPSARPIAAPSMADKLEMVRQLREQMMGQETTSPPPGHPSA